MVTRMYYDSVAVPDIAPAFNAEWDNTVSAVRRTLNITPAGSAMTTLNIAEPVGADASNLDYLLGQWISPPLKAQTISGTVSGRMRVSEGSSGINARAQMIITVINRWGTVVRGTPFAGDLEVLTGDPTSEFSTALVNRQMPRGTTAALTSVAVQHADRLIVSPGARLHNTLPQAFTMNFRFGDAGTTDLAADQVDADDDRPWIEFSADIGFLPDRGLQLARWNFP